MESLFTWRICLIGLKQMTPTQNLQSFTAPAVRNIPANLITEIIVRHACHGLICGESGK